MRFTLKVVPGASLIHKVLWIKNHSKFWEKNKLFLNLKQSSKGVDTDPTECTVPGVRVIITIIKNAVTV